MVGAAEEFALEEARALFETNFFGMVRMILAVAPKMRQQRDGSIVNLSSLVGLVPLPFWGYYSASKFAVEGLTEALREELRPFGIRVSAVEPGTIKTALYTAGPKARSMEAYAPRRGRFEKVMRQFEERAPGPEVVAERVSRIVRSRSEAYETRRRVETSGEESGVTASERRLSPETSMPAGGGPASPRSSSSSRFRRPGWGRCSPPSSGSMRSIPSSAN